MTREQFAYRRGVTTEVTNFDPFSTEFHNSIEHNHPDIARGSTPEYSGYRFIPTYLAVDITFARNNEIGLSQYAVTKMRTLLESLGQLSGFSKAMAFMFTGENWVSRTGTVQYHCQPGRTTTSSTGYDEALKGLRLIRKACEHTPIWLKSSGLLYTGGYNRDITETNFRLINEYEAVPGKLTCFSFMMQIKNKFGALIYFIHHLWINKDILDGKSILGSYIEYDFMTYLIDAMQLRQFGLLLSPTGSVEYQFQINGGEIQTVPLDSYELSGIQEFTTLLMHSNSPRLSTEQGKLVIRGAYNRLTITPDVQRFCVNTPQEGATPSSQLVDIILPDWAPLAARKVIFRVHPKGNSIAGSNRYIQPILQDIQTLDVLQSTVQLEKMKGIAKRLSKRFVGSSFEPVYGPRNPEHYARPEFFDKIPVAA